jgi:hypothetical protein
MIRQPILIGVHFQGWGLADLGQEFRLRQMGYLFGGWRLILVSPFAERVATRSGPQQLQRGACTLPRTTAPLDDKSGGEELMIEVERSELVFGKSTDRLVLRRVN